MKHIFFVQSQITKLISLSVIKELSLSQADIIVITYRNIQFPNTYKSFVCPFSHYPQESFLIYKKFWIGRKKLIKLDTYLEKITDGDFFCMYVPHTFYRMIDLMVSHPKCQSLFLLEEGKESFQMSKNGQELNLSPQDARWLKLNYGSRLSKVIKFFPENYQTAFKFSDAAFPDLNRVRKIKLKLNYSLSYNYDYRHIIVLDSIVEANVIEISDYLIALTRLLFILIERDIKVVYYKFHPDQQLQESRQKILELFESFTKVEFQELNINTSLEEIAVNSEATFYSAVSSVLYYSKYLGSQSYTFINLFPKNKKLSEYVRKQPTAFFEGMSTI